MTDIILTSHSFPDRSVTILIDRTRYEYLFAEGSDVTTILSLFNFYPGKALAYAKKHATSWKNLDERKTG